MHWRDIEQISQDKVQSMVILYRKLKHINTHTVISCTNISIKTLMTTTQEIYITNFPIKNRLGEHIG